MKIFTKGGLGNRLRVLFSRLEFRPIEMAWPINKHCNGRFLDYFEPVDGVTFVDECDGNLDYHGCHAHGKPDYELLVPLPKIVRDVKRHISVLGPRYTSVHIRRTDHVRLAKKRKRFTPDKDFDRFIESTSGPIYIACDCPKTQAAFIARHSTRKILATGFEFLGSHRRSSLQNAILDLYSCVFSFRFKGSGFSSFSDLIEALRGSGVVLSNFKQEPES